MAYLLLAIGVVMAITGAQAAMSGWDIVLVERGWALMIAGAVLGTGGMIVAALGLVLIDLRRTIRRATPSTKTSFGLPGLAGKLPGRTKPAAMPAAAPDPLPAAASATVGSIQTTDEPAAPPASSDAEPSPSTAADSVTASMPEKDRQENDRKPPLFETLLKRATAKPDPASSTKPKADPVIPVADEDLRMDKNLHMDKNLRMDTNLRVDKDSDRDTDLHTDSDLHMDRPSGAEAAAAMRPEAVLPAEPAPQEETAQEIGREPDPANADPIAPQPPKQSEQPEMPEPALAELRPEEPALSVPTVVKTYTAGGHSYIMFSDGTIEADTPEGLFTFQSLEELKTFIAEKAGTAGASAEEKV